MTLSELNDCLVEIQELEKEFSLGKVTIGEIDTFKDAAAFSVLKAVSEFDRFELLSNSPDWLHVRLNDICRIYQETGEYKVYSNLGVSEHSTLVKIFSDKFKQWSKSS